MSTPETELKEADNQVADDLRAWFNQLRSTLNPSGVGLPSEDQILMGLTGIGIAFLDRDELEGAHITYEFVFALVNNRLPLLYSVIERYALDQAKAQKRKRFAKEN